MHGANEIKKHSFFHGKINFVLIRNLTPPIKPKIEYPTDTCNFRSFPEEEDSSIEKDKVKEDEANNPFAEFTPISRPRSRTKMEEEKVSAT